MSTSAAATTDDLALLEARLMLRINELSARVTALEPLAPSALKLLAPAPGATVSGIVVIKGQAGSQWVNVACFDVATGAKVAIDALPSAILGAFALSVDTTKLPNGAAKLSIRAYTVPPGGTGGTSQEIQLALNVSNPITVPPVVTQPSGIRRTADYLRMVGGSNQYPSMQAGVNVWGTAPADYTPPSVINAMRWLTNGSGIYPTCRLYFYAGREQLIKDWITAIKPSLPGITFVVGIGAIAGTTVETMTRHGTALAQLAADPSLGIIAIQGLNEPDNTAFNGQAIPVALTRAAQAALWDNRPPGVTVVGPPITFSTPYPENAVSRYAPPDDMADLLAHMDEASFHLYPFSSPMCEDGSGRGGCVPAVVQGLGKLYGGKPLWCTECDATLYNMVGKASDQVLDGYYKPILTAQLIRHGVRSIQHYPLFDWRDVYKCGMFPNNNANNPRPIAWVVRAQHTILADRGLSAKTFTPVPLEYTVSGLPRPINSSSPNTGGQHMWLACSDGSYRVLLWNEQLAPGGNVTPVTVTFPRVMARVREFNVSLASASALVPVKTTLQSATHLSYLDASFRILEVTP